MSVSVFPAPSTGGGGGGSEASWAYAPASTLTVLTYESAPGSIYRMRAWADNNTTPTVTVNAATSSGVIVQSFTLNDIDTGSTNNYVEKTFRASGSIAKYAVTSNTDSYISIESLSAGVYVTPTITQYNTSQTVTIAAPSSFVLIGGGAGGRGVVYEGDGGGSGYLTSGTIDAGSYALVIGAGGAGGAAGGTSTFDIYSAAGGSEKNGGSGGGAWSNSGARNGGYNGNDGINSPGTGSGVTMPYWRTPAGPAGNFSSGGAAGGLYGGGTGGTNSSPDTTGQSAAANTGGGGGGLARFGGPGAGGSGVLFIGEGV